jgi:hypothetical protein
LNATRRGKKEKEIAMLGYRSLRNPARRAVRLAGLAFLALAASAAGALADPRLVAVYGEVELGRGDPPRWMPAHDGDVLGAGDAVRTGRGGRAEVDLGTGVVRLFESSLLRLPADAMRAEGPAAVGLEHGDSLFEVRPRRPGDPFEVRTPEVVASVKGTRFSVQLGGDGAAVSVFTGLVGVRAPRGDAESEVLVRSGFAAMGSASRPFELSLQSSVDPWQRWQDGAVAPPWPASPSASRGKDDVETAKGAALKAVAPEVLEAAALRDSTEKDASDEAEAHGKSKEGGAPASMPVAGATSVPVGSDDTVTVDPVALADKNGLYRGVQEQIAEGVLNGAGSVVNPGNGNGNGNGSGGSSSSAVTSGSTLLTIDVVTKNGPNRVVVSSPNGVLDVIKEDVIENVLETGNTSLLSPKLLQALSTNGVDPLKFTQQLNGLLDD